MSTSTASLVVDGSTNWRLLLGGEIYDRLVKKGNKLGHQGNKMVRLLHRSGFVPESVGTILGKSKREKEAQRELFVNLSEEGLSFLRDEMTKFFESTEVPNESSLDVGDVSKNTRARVWHLADDPRAAGYLEVIFGGVGKAARRAQLDDKSTRTINNWKILCDEFLNSPAWCPDNPFEDCPRLVDIDPFHPPPTPFEAEELRSLFSKMRSQYSIFNNNFHRSGELVEGEGDGDDEFFEKFAGKDVVYLYAHKLFAGRPPKFCTRDVTQPCDIGISSPTPSSSVSSINSSSGSRASCKRKYSDLSKEDMFEIFKPSPEELSRDKSIKTYFELTTLDNTLKSSNFELMPPDMQQLLRDKYQDLLRSAYV